MKRADVRNEYFEWLSNLVCDRRAPRQLSFTKLLAQLHDIDFRYSIIRDQNRAEDGIALRYRFAMSNGYSDSLNIVMGYLDQPCSVLEMMIALSIHCEEDIMDDPQIGNRTGQWFWGMIINLGLGSMIDSRYDKRFVNIAINRFLDRKYEPDGSGGLFTIRNCDHDLRTVEIWYQLCWYLDSIT